MNSVFRTSSTGLLALLLCIASFVTAAEASATNTRFIAEHLCTGESHCYHAGEPNSYEPDTGAITREPDTKTPLPLIQSLDDNPNATIPILPELDTFKWYFNMAWPWFVGISAGVGVLWALVGGIEIMVSGSDSGRRESGKSRVLWALVGLLIIGLAGVILRTLNPLFYT